MNEIRRRLIQSEDLFRLNYLQGAQLSPDGRTVVYAVSSIDKDKTQADKDNAEEQEYVTLWLLSLETGASRQLSAGLARDSHPQWSPDGKWIAFLSTRTGKPQIHLIPVYGGEARSLTALKQGVGSGPAWSPDGKYIAFTASSVHEPPDSIKPYRITRHIYRLDGMGYVDNAVHDIYLVSVEDGEIKPLTQDALHNSTPSWSPDGQELLYLASLQPDSHLAYKPRLKTVNLAGEVCDLLGEWGYAGSAAWAPDGSAIIFIGEPTGRLTGSKEDLWMVDRQGGEPHCRTTNLKFGAGFLQPDMPALWEQLGSPVILITKDGTGAYVQVQDGGTIQIFRIALRGPEAWTPVVIGERTAVPLDANQEHLLFAVSTLENPVDLFIAGIDGSNERQLTYFNSWLETDLLLATVEHLVFPSRDGVLVEGWLLKPPVGEAPYPTILYSHGGPHAAFGHIFSFDAQMLAGAGYAVLLINYRGSSGYGDEFANQIHGDLGNLEYMDLIAGVDFVIEQGLADPLRLGCCGLSYGGYLSCWIVGQTERFQAAVAENPITNWVSKFGSGDLSGFAVEALGGLPHEVPEVYRRCSPITYAHRCKTPTLLLQGEQDYRCPPEQAEQFYAVLKATGCTVEMVRFPESSHIGSIMGPLVVRRAENELLLDWMNKYVLGRS